MSVGVRFGNHLEENRIVVAHVMPKDFYYVLFVDDKQNDFDYLYEAWAPLYPSVLRTDIRSDISITERVARMDGYEHPVEKIELRESFDNGAIMLSKRNRVPYTKEMVLSLFGETERARKR